MTIRYRLFSPKIQQMQPKGKHRWPLILWLHGYGEAGNGNRRQLAYIKNEVDRWETDKGGFPCFVLAPQCPIEDPSWSAVMLEVAKRLVEQTTREQPIDKSRIYVAGVSSGGTACWKIGQRESTIFAALAPMASAGAVNGDLAKLKGIPIWAFHNAKDSTLPPDRVRKSVAAMKELGGHCWLTETGGMGHDCWTAAFREHDVVEWMLAQRRGHPPVAVPVRSRFASFFQRYLSWREVAIRLLSLAIVAAFAWLCYRDLRRRRQL